MTSLTQLTNKVTIRGDSSSKNHYVYTLDDRSRIALLIGLLGLRKALDDVHVPKTYSLFLGKPKHTPKADHSTKNNGYRS